MRRAWDDDNNNDDGTEQEALSLLDGTMAIPNLNGWLSCTYTLLTRLRAQVLKTNNHLVLGSLPIYQHYRLFLNKPY